MANDSSLTGHVQVTLAERFEAANGLRPASLIWTNPLPHSSTVAQTGAARGVAAPGPALHRRALRRLIRAAQLYGEDCFFTGDSAPRWREWTYPCFDEICPIRPD
ncbi:hypothetical protein KCP73_22400 [Salmonella enterica subsp. enterica]|nr:hypothetical protein KCP73_22400 [Salmonella enterica subsp. enterica]